MARRISASFASLLRRYRDDHPERSFPLGELLQPVLLVDDASHTMPPVPSPTWAARMIDIAAGAGRWSCCVIQAGPGGARVKQLVSGGNTRITLRPDLPTLANQTAVIPAIQNDVGYRALLWSGDAAAEPLTAGRENLLLALNEEVRDLWIPAAYFLIGYGVAANQQASFKLVHVQEPSDTL